MSNQSTAEDHLPSIQLKLRLNKHLNRQLTALAAKSGISKETATHDALITGLDLYMKENQTKSP